MHEKNNNNKAFVITEKGQTLKKKAILTSFLGHGVVVLNLSQSQLTQHCPTSTNLTTLSISLSLKNNNNQPLLI